MRTYTRIHQSALKYDPRIIFKLTCHPSNLASHQAAGFFEIDDQIHFILG